MSTTNNAKRSAYDDKLTAEGGGGANNSPAAKRLKTDTTNTDPTSEVVLNPDILSKALLCIDISEVPPVAQTCKVWKDTLDSVEQTLWKGLVAKHNPTLVQITDMLPDNVGEGEPPTSADGIPAPSKIWKSQFKRRTMIGSSFRSTRSTPRPDLGKYLFEVRCQPSVPPDVFTARDIPRLLEEEVTIIESVNFFTEGSEKGLRLQSLKMPDTDEYHAILLAVYVHHLESGRQIVIYDDINELKWKMNDFVFVEARLNDRKDTLDLYFHKDEMSDELYDHSQICCLFSKLRDWK